MESRGQECCNKIINGFGNVDNLCKCLDSSPNEGLSGDLSDLEERRKVFGRNVIPSKDSKSFLKLFMEAANDVTLIILAVAAFVSLGISFYHFEEVEDRWEDRWEQWGEKDFEKFKRMPRKPASDINEEMSMQWIEGTAILTTVFVVMFVTALNNWTKERQFRKLQNKIEQEQKISVIRGGKNKMVLVSELVVGDICQIKYGDVLPADGILVQNNDLKVDESSLTGESDIVKKGEQYMDVSLLSGTHVMEGSGRMLVTAVGLNSQTGIIMSLLGATESDDKNGNETSKGNIVKRTISVSN